MQISIEIDEAAGNGTYSIDGGEPVQFQSAEEVCQLIEQVAGQSDGDDMAAQNASMSEGVSAVRGGGLGGMM